MSNLLMILFLLIKCIHLSQCTRVIDVMYEDLKSDMSCFIRFNGTHEIGCMSKQGGNVGAIQIKDSSDKNKKKVKIKKNLFQYKIIQDKWR